MRMSSSAKGILALSIFAIAALFASSAGAQTQVGPVRISMLSTGWGSDSFGIFTGSPAVNPAGCSNTDSYMSDGLDPGHKTYYAAALTALTMGASVYIVVSNQNCASSRPNIIGVTIANP